MTLNLLGQKYGELTVKKMVDPLIGPDGRRRRKFFCECTCGGSVEALVDNLRKGHTKSCGCLQDASRRSRKNIHLGEKFGRLTVIGEAEPYFSPGGQTQTRVNARCDCGVEVVAWINSLKQGLWQSCGCKIGDMLLERNFAHGDAFRKKASREYRCWAGIIQRCENPNATKYDIYGGRGITICRKWRESFPSFLADMGRKPSLQHSIDRIDVNGNYEPGNCRWATPKEQANNKRHRSIK